MDGLVISEKKSSGRGFTDSQSVGIYGGFNDSIALLV